MSSSDEGAKAPRRGSPGQSGVPVTVVYYLCRSGRHLEHPHLMELRLASPNQALYLRDVICRLDALRGKGMAAMYSWSCKRRYKTGFVWHDVLEDDVLRPAQGSEYVLKGSLLLSHHSPPAALVAAPPSADHDHTNVSTSITRKVHCVKPTPDEETTTHSREDWTTNSSLPSPPTIEVEVEASPPPHQEPQPELSSISPSSCTSGDRDEEAASARSSSSGSPSSHNKPRGTAEGTPSPSGSTSSPTPLSSLMLYNKLEASVITAHSEVTQTQGTSTGRDLHKKDGCSTDSTPTKATVTTDDKYPGRTRSFSSSTSRNGTLESLIRAEALGRRGATAKRILEKNDDDDDDDDREAMQSLGTKLNPANLLMRLVACGSTMSARQHLPACSLMRTAHKPQYLSQHVELLPSSPVLSPLGALIMRPVTAAGAKVVSDSGDCGHCSGSMLQTAGKGCEAGKVMSTNIKPTSSYDQYCVSEKEASVRNLNNLEHRSQNISQTIKRAPCQQPKSGTLVTITTDVRHNNGEQECSNEASSKILTSTSKRMTDSSPQSSRVVSFHDEKEKAVKIEERLTSGARVIIQCASLLKETYASAKAM